MNNETLKTESRQLANFFRSFPNKLGLNETIISAQLKKAIADDPPELVFLAAWELACMLKSGTNQYRAFAALPVVVQSVRNRLDGTAMSAKDENGRIIHTSTVNDSLCPVAGHAQSNYIAINCPGCWGEIHAGQRLKRDYGNPDSKIQNLGYYSKNQNQSES